MRTKAAILLMSLLAISVAAEAQEDYRIGARDLIEIKVRQDSSLDTTVRVAPDGTIRMSLLDTVPVAGLTATAAGDRIKSLLEARYMNKADVSVVIREFESKPISVFGAVNRPGKIPLSGGMTLIQAISAAGGLSTAAARNIYVLRTGGNGLTSQLVIDADQLMVRGNPDLNIPVQPNDVINVLADRQITIYLIGEVMRPGSVQFRESQNPTLVQALAAGGGLTDRAAKGSIVVKRPQEGKDFKIKLKKILTGEEPDFPLKDNDTVVIPESFF